MTDVFLRNVPSDADPDDVRLYDPTVADGGGPTIIETEFSVVGSSLVTGNAVAVWNVAAAAAGVSTGAADTNAIWNTETTAAGVATAAGDANAIWSSSASAAGVASVSGSAATVLATTALAVGGASVTCDGAALVLSAFAAAGVATVVGQADSLQSPMVQTVVGISRGKTRQARYEEDERNEKYMAQARAEDEELVRIFYQWLGGDK